MDGQSDAVLEVTWERSLKVWWALFWRATVWGALAGAFLGFIGGMIVVVTGKGDGTTVGTILGWLGSIPVSMFVVHHILRKSFKEFSIHLIRRN